MATKLKNLTIKKVDFVDAGANPDATIMLYKNKDGSAAEQKETKSEGMLKRFVSAIGKAIGLKPEEISSTLEEIVKGEAESFGDKMNEVMQRKITDEIWDLCFALNSSLCSIVCDSETENRLEVMHTSLEEFTAVMNGAIEQWTQGNTLNVIKKEEAPTSAEEVAFMKNMRERLDECIVKAEGKEVEILEEPNNITKTEGEETDMSKIDKSKMTPGERAFLEEIEKRYGAEEGEREQKELPVEKAIQKEEIPAAEQTPKEEDVYKGLHPTIVKELEALRKRADVAEEKELLDIAKKYEVIGKKPEELLSVLKSLKQAGGTAYEEMLSILDASVTAVEKSGLFSEIGKSGVHQGNSETEAIAKVRTKVSDLRKARPELTEAQAMDQVLMEDDQLRAEFDQ